MKRYSADPHQWLAQALEDYGRGARIRLAHHMQLRPDAITRMTNTEPGKETRDISAKELAKMVTFFKSAPGGLRSKSEDRPNGGGRVRSFDPDQDVAAISADGTRINIPEGEIPQVSSRIGMGHGTDEPTIEIPAGEGSVAGVQVIDTWKIPKNVLQRRLRGAVSNLHIVECEGDSMEPRIHDGDFVFIDTSRRVPSPPGIFALNDGFGQTLKRLEIIPNSDPPRVKIIPENGRHESYERDLEEVRIIGRYLCRLTMD